MANLFNMELKVNDNLEEKLDLIFSTYAATIEALVSKSDSTGTGNIFSRTLDMNGFSILNCLNIEEIAAGSTPSPFMRYATYDYDNDGIVTTAKDIYGVPGNSTYFYGTNVAGTLGAHPLPDGTGDMLKSVYDPDADGVLTTAVNAVVTNTTASATEAASVTGAEAAENGTYYGTDSGGVEGFHLTPFLPVGSILIWSGAITDIPVGWAVCNGNSGTPNLIDRFVLHADGVTNDVGDSGEGITETTSTALSTSTIPAHDHSTLVGLNYLQDLSNTPRLAKRVLTQREVDPPYEFALVNQGTANLGSTGSTAGHTHQALNKKPKYYALAYIMRIA